MLDEADVRTSGKPKSREADRQWTFRSVTCIERLACMYASSLLLGVWGTRHCSGSKLSCRNSWVAPSEIVRWRCNEYNPISDTYKLYVRTYVQNSKIEATEAMQMDERCRQLTSQGCFTGATLVEPIVVLDAYSTIFPPKNSSSLISSP